MRGRRLRRPPGRPPPARRTRARSGRKACARSAALRRRGGAPGWHARCRGSPARRTGRSRPREERCDRNEQRIDEGEEGERRVELAVGLDLKADALRVHGDGDEQEADEGRGSRRDGAQQRGRRHGARCPASRPPGPWGPSRPALGSGEAAGAGACPGEFEAGGGAACDAYRRWIGRRLGGRCGRWEVEAGGRWSFAPSGRRRWRRRGAGRGRDRGARAGTRPAMAGIAPGVLTPPPGGLAASPRRETFARAGLPAALA